MLTSGDLRAGDTTTPSLAAPEARLMASGSDLTRRHLRAFMTRATGRALPPLRVLSRPAPRDRPASPRRTRGRPRVDERINCQFERMNCQWTSLVAAVFQFSWTAATEIGRAHV